MNKKKPRYGQNDPFDALQKKRQRISEHPPKIPTSPGLNREAVKGVKQYIDIAKSIRKGEEPDISEDDLAAPIPFSEKEMEVVHKLIWDRKSIRNWIDKPVPEDLIKQILEAGRAAPVGCNLDAVRFVVLKSTEEKSMIWSDISTENAVIIVICFDKRISETVGQDKLVPQNLGYDAAAAGDHMLLMAHALGLGGVWLSKTVKSDFTKDSGKEFKELFGLPGYIEVAMHIAVGWAESGIIKSKRVPLSDMILTQLSKDPKSVGSCGERNK